MKNDFTGIKNGSYFVNGIETTDAKMIEILEMMANPPVYVKDFRPRSQKTMAKDFIVRPFDNFEILHSSGVISSSIGIHVTNSETKEDFYLGMDNKLEAWKLLKRIHEMGNRNVSYKIDDNEPFPYEESEAYKYRFGATA